MRGDHEKWKSSGPGVDPPLHRHSCPAGLLVFAPVRVRAMQERREGHRRCSGEVQGAARARRTQHDLRPDARRRGIPHRPGGDRPAAPDRGKPRQRSSGSRSGRQLHRPDLRRTVTDMLQRPGLILLAALAAIHAPELRAQQPAPAADGVQAQIATAVAAYRAPQRSGSVDYGATQALSTVYAQRANAPLWSRDGRATPQAQAVIRELQRADTYGLQREDYGGDALAALADKASASAVADAGRWGRFDVQLSAAALRFMSDLHYGRVKPTSVGFNLQPMHQRIDLGASLTALADATDVAKAINEIEPPFHHYALLKGALTKYLGLTQHPELKNLPAISGSVKPGNAYAGAPALRRLLVALGDLPAGSSTPADETTLTPELSAGVRTFQQRHGLTPDGALGKTTFTALTTPFAKRVRQMDLTLERWRWLPPFDTPPIIVNIPQFRLFAFRTTEDRVADILQMDVIVGKTYTQTPVFESDMRYVVFRPYWDIPPSILRNEMLPKIRANPGYVAANRLQIVGGQGDDSPVVAPSPAAIEGLASGKLRLRQIPGPDNALGLVKF